MYLVIGNMLDQAELAAIQAQLPHLHFDDGKKTAGRHAKLVKNNDQASPTDARNALLASVKERLLKHPLFVAAARPKMISNLLLSRYSDGQSYGLHVDDALMGGLRSDISFTLFLSPPESYDGGELVIEDYLEDRQIKLAAGDIFIYPSTSLHRVAPVSRGTRHAIVGWVTSWVRDPAKREILFDLDQAIDDIFAHDGKTPSFDRLTKSRSNLLRLWIDQ